MPEIFIARARLSCLRRSFTTSNHRFPSNLTLPLAPNFASQSPTTTFLRPRTMATLGAYQKKHKVAIVGSGNWYVTRIHFDAQLHVMPENQRD